MEKQEYFDEITDIVVVSGSGGTGLDLALANYWTGSKKAVHGIRTWGDSKYFYGHAKATLEDAGIYDVEPREIMDCIGKKMFSKIKKKIILPKIKFC